jgi:superkiller protein 3
LDPQNASAHNSRGNALGSLERSEDALAAHDEALRLDPQDAGAHANRRLTLREMGRHE